MEKKKRILVGGQAVIEGVMMRAPGAYSTAVRRENGEIEVERNEFTSILEKRKRLNIPVLRGIIALFETMKIGFATLQWSADKNMEDLEPDKETKAPGKLAKAGTLLFALSLRSAPKRPGTVPLSRTIRPVSLAARSHRDNDAPV